MLNQEIEIPQRPKRTFLNEDFKLDSWASLQPYYDKLLHREINSADELWQWFKDRNELEAFLSEDFAWRYIRQTRHTENEQFINELQFFITEIQPKIIAYGNEFDRKALASPFIDQLDEKGMGILLRNMRTSVEIFREENIPLLTEAQTEERKYGAIAGAMTVTLDGEEMTLQKASDRLQSTDRNVREKAWKAIAGRRYEDHEKLNHLFDKLIALRDKIGKNAGFANYRDYMFSALGRVDYTPEDCFQFHASVREAVVPEVNALAVRRSKEMKVDPLRPWDFRADPKGRPPLVPFNSEEELLAKAIRAFTRLDKSLGETLITLKAMDHLDLGSRKGKAPGGYNYPLAEIGVPFIFMNATSTLRDMVTLVHEGGHAVHSIATRNLALNAFKSTPSEVAELASMSMELLTMDFWGEFFPNTEDLRRAKVQHLESILETLPWVAAIDKFQHWIYEHPAHLPKERNQTWTQTYDDFSDKITDWSGLEKFKAYMWQRQLHLYEVPFYYIEYGIAQLGAIGIWKNYRQNPKKALEGYLAALRLGYTAPIREIYKTAGIPFDFSKKHIADLMEFVKTELTGLYESNS